MTSPQGGSFGNPFANGGTHKVNGRLPLSKRDRATSSDERRRPTGLQTSSSAPHLGSKTRLPSDKSNRRHTFSASSNKSEWGSPEKNEDAERRRLLADRYSKRVRIQNKSLKTGRGLERRGLIHERQWGISISRNSIYFGIGLFESDSLFKKNARINHPLNNICSPPNKK